MAASLVVTVIGPDRPGLVSLLSDRGKAHDASWAESRMASLAGQFAGIVHFQVGEANAEALATALRGLDSSDLHVAIVVGETGAVPPAQRTLPERLTLRYGVQAGEGGFNLGQAFYTWQRRDGRYSLVSIARATGLTALFVSGKLVQTSLGTITPNGLQPEHYWFARNERKQDTAHFDWKQGRVVQGGGSAELPPGSQDLLSFPFHLAMTVDESAREWSLWVSNGRKLREYLFRNLGRERLTLGEREVDTLHVQGSRSGEGTLDVWLAPSHHWLPLRIRTLDQKGKVFMLSLEEVS